jgi:ABC-type sugar transport system ATPase subunit
VTLLLDMRNVHKRYPGVHALKGISFSLREGELHALVGENGAGKSTLIKVLGGVVVPDEGELLVRGIPARWAGPGDAIRAGVGIIHQELSLAPHLSVAENIYLGREPRRGPFVDRKRLRDDAARLVAGFGVDIDVKRPAGALPPGEQQLVEIAKALSQNVSLLAMDEPTSSLSARETESLFRVMADLKAKGVGIIYISHRMEEIFALADRISVLRDGEMAGSAPAKEFDPEKVISLMVGRRMETLYPRTFREPGEEFLRVEGLSRKDVLKDITFSLRSGEILGIAGLVGSGRTELARCLVGLDGFDGGRIVVEGAPFVPRNPGDALRKGIVLVPEDRKRQGLFLNRTIRDNVATMKLLQGLRRGLFTDRAAVTHLAETSVQRLGVRCRSVFEPVFALSGGNQQKVAIAKGLAVTPKVLVLDEPTRGVDVGAKAEIHQIMNDLAAGGMAILMISSDLPEVLGMSDAVLVFREGRCVARFSRQEGEPDRLSERVMAAATGGVAHA